MSSSWADRLRTSSGVNPAVASVHLPLQATAADPTRLTRSGSECFAAVNESPRSPLIPLIVAPSGRTAPHGRCAVTELDVGVWIDVLRFLGYRDVCQVGSTCRGLWTLHLTDHVWHDQERYLRRELALLRGGEGAVDLLPSSEAAIPSPSPNTFEASSLKGPVPAAHRYLQFKRLKVLAAKDIRREWDFRELVGRLHANDRQRVFFMNQPDMQPREGVMTRILTGSMGGAQLWIRKSEIRLFDAARVGGKALRPSQILTVCDDVAANVDGRIPVLETTDAQDDPSIVPRLHLGLAARQAGDNLLFSLGPRIKLVEVSREEAETILQEEIVVRVPLYANLIESFVIDPQTTRYFVGPELCRSGERVGMIVVDDLRMLLVLCTE